MKRTKESKLKGMKDFLREEEGMGTVEIILIIVEIFTLWYGVGIRCIE